MDFFKGLFRKPKPDETQGAKTAPLDSGVVAKPPPQKGNRYEVGVAQSAGIERTHNEDAVLVMHGTSGGETPVQDFGVFIVADGMGGHRSGEVASALSARTVAQRLTARALASSSSTEESYSEPLQDVVRESLEDANQAVVERVPGGGTTLTVAVILGSQVTLGHVGDTRAYLFEENGARVITRDHSLVKRLEELGQLTPEEAETHPQRNVLYRAIGQGANLEIDVMTHPLPSGGMLLICSDGLWGVVTDPEIERLVRQSASVQAACDDLVAAANAAGGPDNITAVLIRYD
jgi:protein phosphatase